MKRFFFKTKARNLAELSEVLTSAEILPLIRITSDECKDIQNVAAKIQSFFVPFINLFPLSGNAHKQGDDIIFPLIVRSSACSEDQNGNSKAGKFRSIPEVPLNNSEALCEAVLTVMNSFGNSDNGDEVFVQPMLRNISMAGVAFTSDPDNLAPYFIINFDMSGKYNGVTKGIHGTQTYVQFKDSQIECPDPQISAVIDSCREIEDLYRYPCIDVEFAFSQNKLYILQVRPLGLLTEFPHNSISDKLLNLHGHIKELSAPKPGIYGKKSVYGVMPDWNPAEIIGIRPHPLAMSLYMRLITDDVWAEQRRLYGYRDVRPHPLMHSFMGFPFIDVRTDFNSFLPASLPPEISEKLVDFYLDKLISNPSLHDKVEFEIVHSCFYPGIEQRMEELSSAGFTPSEIDCIKKELKKITDTILTDSDNQFYKNMEKTAVLREKHSEIVNSSMSDVKKIPALISACMEYGTLSFAGIARSAFVGMQFLNEFVNLGIMSSSEYNDFLSSLTTVSTRLISDYHKLMFDDITREEFFAEYGHLRPGTYDILSLRYDEDPDLYFSGDYTSHIYDKSFSPSTQFIEKADRCLSRMGLKRDALSLLNFIKEVIEGREYSKFIFSRSVSEILSLLVKAGEKFNISREDLAFLDIKILEASAGLENTHQLISILRENIERNKKDYTYTTLVKLPPVIIAPEQVFYYFLTGEEPSFITMGRVCGKPEMVDSPETARLEGKIAFIRSAEPGYDFIFSTNIKALVTQYGGSNSHIAIRCAEMKIPAVIGVGERNFELWKDTSLLEIDCAGRLVKIIKP